MASRAAFYASDTASCIAIGVTTVTIAIVISLVALTATAQEDDATESNVQQVLACVNVNSPVMTAPAFVAHGSGGNTASVTPQTGVTYSWDIAGGTITAGQGTSQISFNAGSAGTRMAIGVVGTTSAGCASARVSRQTEVDFLDTPIDNFHAFIILAATYGVMPGCGSGNFCPTTSVTRAQMAGYFLRSEHGGDYSPPPATGIFNDVSISSPDAPWIEQLFHEGVTAGCGGGGYCPNSVVNRAQMATFLLKAKYVAGYAPPACQGIFPDVQCNDPTWGPFAPWIEELYKEGITAGCGGGNYCPSASTAQNQMSVFQVKTYGVVGAAAVWYLDDAVPSAVTVGDYSGNGDTGALTGTVVVTGRAGYGRQFSSAAHDAIQVNATPSVAIAQDITIEAWVKPTSVGPMSIVNKAPNSGSSSGAPGNFDLYLGSQGHITFGHEAVGGGSNTYVLISPVPPANTWTHIAVAWGKGHVTFYVNGAYVVDGSDSGETATTNSTLVRIGQTADNLGANGIIDEVKMWPYARTARQIASSYIPQTTCWGANPNDTQPDDAALQACLDKGGEVRLIRGTPGYQLSTGLTISKNGTVITGVDPSALALLQATGTLAHTMLYATSRQNVIVGFLELDGNRPARQALVTGLCQGYRIAAVNLAIQDSTGFSESDNKSTHAVCGSSILANGTTFSVSRNLIIDNGHGREDVDAQGPWADGITLELCADGIVQGNTVTDATDVGIVILKGSPTTPCQVLNNTIQSVTRHLFAGIAFDGSVPGGPTTLSTVSGNVITSVLNKMSFGISVGIHAWSTLSTTVGGTVTGNTVSGAFVNLEVDGVSGATVTGNTLSGAQGTPLCGASPAQNFTSYAPHVASSTIQAGSVSRSYDGCIP